VVWPTSQPAQSLAGEASHSHTASPTESSAGPPPGRPVDLNPGGARIGCVRRERAGSILRARRGGYGVACWGQAARGGSRCLAGLRCVDGGICRRGQGGAAVVTEAVRGHRPAVVSCRADDGGSPEDGRAGEGYPSLLLMILVQSACVNCIVNL